MWSIIVEKVENEAMDKVTEVEEEYDGDGLMAWHRVHKWYTKLSGEGLPEKRKYVVAPPTPRRESEIPEALDKWLLAVREMEKLGKPVEAGTKMGGLQRLLVGEVGGWGCV